LNNPLLPLILSAFPLFLPQAPLFPDLLTQRLPAVVSLRHQTNRSFAPVAMNHITRFRLAGYRQRVKPPAIIHFYSPGPLNKANQRR
jgi:hypothetical protein